MKPNFSNHHGHIYTILRAALRAADPAEAVQRFLFSADVQNARRVFVVGAGKAGVAMTRAVTEFVGEKLTGGVVAVPHADVQIPKINFVVGGHPIPSEGSVLAGSAIAELLRQVTADDLVIVVISGGGSALLEFPVEEMTLNDLRQLTNHLLKSGAPIEELNCVRKHLSQIKGGGLLRMAGEGRVLALILSDVIDDPLDVIASGPTISDSTTVEEARQILLRRNAPPKFKNLLQETLKPAEMSRYRVENRLVGSNALAREAAARAARELGFEAILSSFVIQGEARQCAQQIVDLIEISDLPRAFIYGGEPTVTVKGDGIGGRNQEFVLAAAIALDKRKLDGVVIASAGTDGVDGMTAAAGAFATSETFAAAHQQGLDPQAFLDRNDSHSFFKAIDQLIETGPTGTNVNDVVLVLVYKKDLPTLAGNRQAL